MKALIEFFLAQPLLVKIIFFAVMGYGALQMTTIQKEAFPAVSLNTMTVTTVYPGASAEDVELNVTAHLEEEIAEVDGLYEVTSISRENISLITVQADESASPDEFAAIVNDVRQAVDQAKDLPDDINGKPIVDVLSTGDKPIIAINFSGDHALLRTVLPPIERAIETLPGIAGADKIGYFDREIHIEVDPIKSRRLRVSVADVLRSIQARNLRTTGGTLESYLNERTVVSLNKFDEPKDVGAVILRSSFTGQTVRVRDVATIELREKNETFIVRNNGKPGMGLVLRKKSSADIIRTLDAVKQYMGGYTLPDGVTFQYSNDQSALTRLRLKVLSSNALMGFALVAVFLLLALGVRTALWTAMSIPFSLFGTFILVAQFGITLTAISLAGFVLVLGLLVDDAIVVAEKVSQLRESGLSALDAAREGAASIWRPVVVASITTVLAFVPMFYLGGRPGKFAWAIPAVVIIALLVSLFDSFLILPSHLVSSRKSKVKSKPGWMVKLEAGYARLLESLLHGRYWVVLMMLVVFGGGVFLAKTRLQTEMFPQSGVERFYIKLEMPQGASLNAVQKRLATFETEIAKLPTIELDSYSTRVGTLSTSANKNRGDHSHWGVVWVYLTGEARRTRSAAEIIGHLRSTITATEGEHLVFETSRMGPAIGKPIDIRVKTNNDALRKSTSDEVIAFLSEVDGVSDVESLDKPGKTQLIVDINYRRLAEVELTVKDVSEALRVAYDGVIVSSTTSVDESLEYRVIMAPEFRDDPKFIYSIPVTNRRGQVLNLRDVVSLRKGSGPLEMHHINGIRAETITGDIDIEVTAVAVVQRAVKEHFSESWAQHPEMQVTFGGEARESKKIMGDFLGAGAMALIGIFLVVTLLLGSLAQPLIVLAAIPFAVVGVIYALWAHDMPLSFFSTMGTLGLIGVVVNDTILMVTESNRELADHPRDYLVDTIVAGARQRLRPVLLTTVTTVAGLMPTAYGIGGKDALIMPLTLAMAYGLLFATSITLVLTPAMIVIGHDIGSLFGRGSGHKRGRRPSEGATGDEATA